MSMNRLINSLRPPKHLMGAAGTSLGYGAGGSHRGKPSTGLAQWGSRLDREVAAQTRSCWGDVTALHQGHRDKNPPRQKRGQKGRRRKCGVGGDNE